MDTNNIFYTYFIEYINYFYNYNKLKPSQPVKKYIENYKNSHKFKKLPLIYTNPRWDYINKKLLWYSFDQELYLAKRRPQYNNFYCCKYKNVYHWNYNKNISYDKNNKFIYNQSFRWNKEKQKLEWNFIYKK